VFYFVANVALCSATEVNLWSERRKAAVSNKPVQIASLPQSLQSLNQLPVTKMEVQVPLRWKTKDQKLQNLLSSISPSDATIQDVHDAGTSDTPVVLVQDVHLNTEAQKNIAELLQGLIDRDQVGLVGVEGAFVPFDFSRLRAFPDTEINKEVLDAFVGKNLLSAPSYVGVMSEKTPPPFIGIDDKVHYDANVQAYLDSRHEKENALRQIAASERELMEKKKQVFSSDLLRFDELRRGYHAKEIGFGRYVKELNKYGFSKSFVIDQFLEAYDMEESIDFHRVESERVTVIKTLTEKMTEEDIARLVDQSRAYQMGQIGFGDFYQQIKNLCQKYGISLRLTPHFENYVRYVLLSDGIKTDELFSAVETWERKICDALATSLEQKQLLAQSEHLSLTRKLLDFSLTSKEWERYKSFCAPS
jgi:hypothetical protein